MQEQSCQQTLLFLDRFAAREDRNDMVAQMRERGCLAFFEEMCLVPERMLSLRHSREALAVMWNLAEGDPTEAVGCSRHDVNAAHQEWLAPIGLVTKAVAPGKKQHASGDQLELGVCGRHHTSSSSTPELHAALDRPEGVLLAGAKLIMIGTQHDRR